MNYNEEKAALINQAAQDAANIDGYKVLKSPERNYFFIITPADNVLYIQSGEFFGLDASLQYQPARNTGSACRCNEKPFYNVTPELLEELETAGMKFARKLKAKFYPSSAAWLNKYWERETLETL